MITFRKSAGVAAALALALSLSACSSSSETATETPAASAPAASAPANPSPTATSSVGAANEAFCTSSAALKTGSATFRRSSRAVRSPPPPCSRRRTP